MGDGLIAFVVGDRHQILNKANNLGYLVPSHASSLVEHPHQIRQPQQDSQAPISNGGPPTHSLAAPQGGPSRKRRRVEDPSGSTPEDGDSGSPSLPGPSPAYSGMSHHSNSTTPQSTHSQTPVVPGYSTVPHQIQQHNQGAFMGSPLMGPPAAPFTQSQSARPVSQPSYHPMRRSTPKTPVNTTPIPTFQVTPQIHHGSQNPISMASEGGVGSGSSFQPPYAQSPVNSYPIQPSQSSAPTPGRPRSASVAYSHAGVPQQQRAASRDGIPQSSIVPNVPFPGLSNAAGAGLSNGQLNGSPHPGNIQRAAGIMGNPAPPPPITTDFHSPHSQYPPYPSPQHPLPFSAVTPTSQGFYPRYGAPDPTSSAPPANSNSNTNLYGHDHFLPFIPPSTSGPTNFQGSGGPPSTFSNGSPAVSIIYPGNGPPVSDVYYPNTGRTG